MGWLVLNWGEGRGSSGVGRTDRCPELLKPYGVVRSDRLEGHMTADSLRGPTGIEFGTTGFGAAFGL